MFGLLKGIYVIYVYVHEHVHGTVPLMLRLISAPYIILLVSLFCIAPCWF